MVKEKRMIDIVGWNFTSSLDSSGITLESYWFMWLTGSVTDKI